MKRRPLCICISVIVVLVWFIALLGTDGSHQQTGGGGGGNNKNINNADEEVPTDQPRVQGQFQDTANDDKDTMTTIAAPTTMIPTTTTAPAPATAAADNLDVRRRSPFLPSWVDEYERTGTIVSEAYFPPGTSSTRRHAVVRKEGACLENDGGCRLEDGCVADMKGVCYNAPYNLLGGYEYRPTGMSRSQVIGQTFNNRTNFRVPKGGRLIGDDLVCSWQTNKPTALPAMVEDKTLEKATHTMMQPSNLPADIKSIMRAWKHFTGSFHWLWYDWRATVVHLKPPPPPPPLVKTMSKNDDGQLTAAQTTRRDSFQMTAEHDGPDQIYRIRNFCLRAGGSFAGFRPNISLYNGGIDISAAFPSYGKSFHADKVNEFLSSTEHLPVEPEWFIDRKLVILPLFDSLGKFHPAHTLTRAGALVYNVESGFPRSSNSSGGERRRHSEEGEDGSARRDVTTVYLSMRNPLDWCGETCSTKTSQYYRYSTLATRTHFSAFTTEDQAIKAYHAANPHLAKELVHPLQLEQLRALVRTPICFREAIIYQSCWAPDCHTRNVTHRNTWSLWGWRNPKTQELIARRFRQCAAVSDPVEREHNDGRGRADPVGTVGPTVLYTYRRFNKNLIGYRSLVPEFVRWVHEAVSPKKPRIIVTEFVRFNTVELISLYSQVDMIFGVYSTGFMYGFLCPFGSVGVEVGWTGTSSAPVTSSGVNRDPTTDYGSMWAAVPFGRQFGLRLPERGWRAPDGEVEAPWSLLERMVKGSLAIIESNRNYQKKFTVERQLENSSSPSPPLDDSDAKELLEQQRIKYEIPITEIEAAQDQMYRDYGGVALVREIRATLPRNLVPYCRGLVHLHKNADKLSSHFYPLRSLGGQVPTTTTPWRLWDVKKGQLLLVLKCGASLLVDGAAPPTTGVKEEEDTSTPPPPVEEWDQRNSTMIQRSILLTLQVLRRYVGRTVDILVVLQPHCNAAIRHSDLQVAIQERFTWMRKDDGLVVFCGQVNAAVVPPGCSVQDVDLAIVEMTTAELREYQTTTTNVTPRALNAEGAESNNSVFKFLNTTVRPERVLLL